MAIKYSVQGLLIYLTMATYLLALILTIARRRRGGWIAYGCGFVVACVMVGFRAWHTGHAPLQNLFEVFCVLAALVFPLSILGRRAWGVADEAWDMALGLLLLVPAGFVFSARPQVLPPALQSPLFVPHVLSYVAAYVLMAKATIQAVRLWLAKTPTDIADRDNGACRVTRAGFVLLTAGLLLGAWWGKLAWGDWWNWDPKEMWSLATWLIYLAYFHYRAANGRRHYRINAALLALGMAAVLITLLAVSLARVFAGKHSYAM